MISVSRKRHQSVRGARRLSSAFLIMSDMSKSAVFNVTDQNNNNNNESLKCRLVLIVHSSKKNIGCLYTLKYTTVTLKYRNIEFSMKKRPK